MENPKEFGELEEDNFIKMKSANKNEKFKGCSQSILFYGCLFAWAGLVCGFVRNRILSNRVNELQGKVDNLYQKINDSKKSNGVLNVG